jgi:hypothetical protein
LRRRTMRWAMPMVREELTGLLSAAGRAGHP